MENAALISLSQQMALKRRMDMIANNLANMNTAGYKADSLQFEEFVMPVARVDGISGPTGRLSYVQDGSVVRNFVEGEMERTGNALDVAISGDAWFVVQTPDGERYTRNGEFKLDAQGQLITGAGFPVLSEGGTIQFGPQESGIEIAKDGTISTTQGSKGRLRLVKFDNNHGLKKVGSSVFASDVPPQPATDVSVAQGMIERSNVEPVLELTRMIETMRAYTQTAQTLQTSHDVRRSAIDRLAGTES